MAKVDETQTTDGNKKIDDEPLLKDSQSSFRPQELRLKVDSLSLKIERSELDQPHKDKGISPSIATVLAALLGLLTAAIVAILQGNSNRQLEREKFEFSKVMESQQSNSSIELERKKFESSLILKAIETGDTTVAAENLLFLIDAGYIQIPREQIEKYAKKPGTARGPVLPRPNSSPSRSILPSFSAELNLVSQIRDQFNRMYDENNIEAARRVLTQLGAAVSSNLTKEEVFEQLDREITKAIEDKTQLQRLKKAFNIR